MRLLVLMTMTLLLISCGSGEKLSESERFNRFADRLFDSHVDRSPQWQTMLGIKKDYGHLDDISEEREIEDHKITKQFLEEIKEFNPELMDEKTRVSYQLLRSRLEEGVEDYQFRHFGFPVNQMFGTHSEIPSFMINMHRVSSEEDIVAYISRVSQIQRQFGQLMDNMKKQEEKGIIPPRFVYDHVIRDISNLLAGKPFDKKGQESPILADFNQKIKTLKLSQEAEERYRSLLVEQLKLSYFPAYTKLLAFMRDQKSRSKEEIGLWALPGGDKYYQVRLKRRTTTDMTPEQIHQLGLSEVKRIHEEMNALKEKIGFKGSLKQFFKHVKNKRSLKLPNTPAGKKKYVVEANKIIANMKKDLPKLFNIAPKAGLVVKPVEAFREKSAGIAFYQGPTSDGSRPGIYYVNTYDMNSIPLHEMEALAYHEAIPGHHMQISISRELEGLPKFRKYWGYTAFSEGWGLYSEYIPKEIGKYKDPYSDFGRLSYELWRATRLVVDTGIHYKRWSYEQSVQYLLDNTPNDRGEIVKAVERYSVMPGQATAYKIGMLKILELRKMAQKKLGKDFDIRLFHDEVLRHGAVPLYVLEDIINDWVARQKSV